MAAKESALTSTLGTAPTPSTTDPYGLVEKLGSKSDTESRGQYAYQQAPALLRGKGEAEGEVARREFDIQQGTLRKTAEAEQGLATEARKQYGEYEAGLKAPGEFQVPEYTASDYAKGAAQRLVSAFLIGGITKQSAKSQLQMIKSMQDAEDRGLDTEFQAARMKFDEAEKAKDKHNKRLKERFDSLMDLASKDRNAALAQAKLIEADVGQGLIAAKIRSGEWGEAKKLFDTAMQNLDKLKLVQAKDAGKGASGLKPGAELVKNHLMKSRLVSYAEQMQKQLQNPEFAKKLDQYRALAFVSEKSPEADQILQKNIPEDVASFLILAKRFRNEVYRSESGLAVTGYEQARQYGAVPQPGDSSQRLITKLATVSRGMRDDLANERRIFPALSNAAMSEGLPTSVSQNAPQTSGGGDIATEADIKQTMKDNNLTREAAIQKIRDAGYQIEGEGEEE